MVKSVTFSRCFAPVNIFPSLVLLLLSGGLLVRSQQMTLTKATKDGSVSISLENYSKGNQSTYRMDVLAPQSTTIVFVQAAPPNVHFYVFQAHSFFQNISLSYNKTLDTHNHINGTNLGLVWNKNQGDGKFYVSNLSFQNITVMYAVVAYGLYTPIPGGCNMEFEVETAPYLRVWHSDAVVEVNAQPALSPGSSCERDIVTYGVYRRYMYERDFSQESYFASLQTMLTPNDILAHGTLAPDPVYGSLMRRLYSLYPGTGSVYTVLAHSLTGVSAYVPAVSYGCSAVFFTDSCSVLNSTFAKVLCACVLFLGFFACFYGHEFFRTLLFLSGFLTGSLLAYIGLSRSGVSLAEGSDVSLSCVVGTVLGASYVIAWRLIGSPVMAIVFLVAPFGFILASLFFFAGLGDLQFAQMELDFWLTFFMFLMGAALLMVTLLHHGCILACAVVGAYATIVPFDHYTGGNLKYIVINTLRRAALPGFALAVIDPPFQTADALLSVLWLLLAAVGFRIQQLRQRGKPPFPPARRLAPGSPWAAYEPRHFATARTPLRVSSFIPRGYGSVGDDDVFETPPSSAPGPPPQQRRSLTDWLGGGLGLGLRGR